MKEFDTVRRIMRIGRLRELAMDSLCDTHRLITHNSCKYCDLNIRSSCACAAMRLQNLKVK